MLQHQWCMPCFSTRNKSPNANLACYNKVLNVCECHWTWYLVIEIAILEWWRAPDLSKMMSCS
jgi:hypothetical protein